MTSCNLYDFLGRMGRRKAIVGNSSSQLARVLNTLDLVGLGIASTMGSGIYVIIGQVAQAVAGPSIVLSFVIAGVACVIAGLCYAEFGARVPKAGSAYIYSYVTVGEIWAFAIGWNLILEYVIGTASIARATSSYIDSLTHGALVNFSITHMPINVKSLSDYPDILAFTITIIFAVGLCFGVKESSVLNNIFTVVNVGMTAFIIICGAFKVDPHNWNLSPSEIPYRNGTENLGVGGFFPYGVSGMLKGAATCFYAFVGFDIIATTGEEVMNPHTAIPWAIIASLTICGSAYIGVAAVITLIVPYWTLEGEAQLPPAFDRIGYSFATYFITAGALSSLFTCLLTTIIPMPRVIFAMARDGLLFKFLGKVSIRFKTPYVATLLSAFIAGLMAMMFELAELVNMMAIGTLLAYTLVAACVLILRYEPAEESTGVQAERADSGTPTSEASTDSQTSRVATSTTSKNVKIAVVLLVVETVWLDVFGAYGADRLVSGQWWAILLIALPAVSILATLLFIALQPRGPELKTFQVPLVPVVPAISMVLNVYLMLKLSYLTWIRFGIWIVVGFLIYFLYGIRNSSANRAYRIDDDDNIDEPIEPEDKSHQANGSVPTTEHNERTPLLA